MRLHAPSGVLAVWALAWSVGVQGNAVIVIGLVVTAASAVVHSLEVHRRHRRV